MVARIDRGTVVTLVYELKDSDGKPLEEPDAELAYLHGYGGIFPKVEEALQGKRSEERRVGKECRL